MKASSQDVRERVLRAVDQGYPRAQIVKMFGVSIATIKRYLKQRRETGQVKPKAIPGRPPKKSAPLRAGEVAATRSASRCDFRTALSVVGASPWSPDQQQDDESSHQAAGLDTKKTVSAIVPYPKKC
jgi:Homeodomain-like domain